MPWHVLGVVGETDPAGTTAWSTALESLDTPSGWGRFTVERCADHASAAARLAQSPVDVVIAGESTAGWPGLAQTALNTAVLLISTGAPAPDDVRRWMQLGVQDVLPSALASQHGELARAVALAVERKRLEREARKAYATDLGTGLPAHTQLIEHMSHLLALREREPAPMALLVLRIEGLQTVERRLGGESAQVLRRKAAVRLRAGVRASDVVASLGADAFAVLLSAIEEPEHAFRVADKLALALQQPFSVAGEQTALAVSTGAALYPADGKLADQLVRIATTGAAMAPAQGRIGYANRVEGGRVQAANDDEAP